MKMKSKGLSQRGIIMKRQLRPKWKMPCRTRGQNGKIGSMMAEADTLDLTKATSPGSHRIKIVDNEVILLKRKHLYVFSELPQVHDLPGLHFINPSIPAKYKTETMELPAQWL